MHFQRQKRPESRSRPTSAQFLFSSPPVPFLASSFPFLSCPPITNHLVCQGFIFTVSSSSFFEIKSLYNIFWPHFPFPSSSQLLPCSNPCLPLKKKKTNENKKCTTKTQKSKPKYNKQKTNKTKKKMPPKKSLPKPQWVWFVLDSYSQALGLPWTGVDIPSKTH